MNDIFRCSDHTKTLFWLTDYNDIKYNFKIAVKAFGTGETDVTQFTDSVTYYTQIYVLYYWFTDLWRWSGCSVRSQWSSQWRISVSKLGFWSRTDARSLFFCGNIRLDTISNHVYHNLRSWYTGADPGFVSAGGTKKCWKPRSQQYWAKNVQTVYWWIARKARLKFWKLEIYKTVWNYDACYKLISIELEMYQQYMDELRAKRAANFEEW